MLRYKEKQNFDARFAQTEAAVEQWQEATSGAAKQLRQEFGKRLQISLIYHDAALEGDVLTYSEIKAAVDPSIISDSSLIPSYESIKRYYDACQFAYQFAGGKKKVFKLETLREIYSILAVEEKEKGLPYRKENPLHRLYYHEIANPEKIPQLMRKLGKWLEEPATRHLHPIERVAQTHFKIMRIFPWAKQSGRCARIASNLLLRQASYPIAVIHSIDRQAYYESLRNDYKGLLSVYLEAVETAALSEVRLYEEAARSPRRRRA
ncbi:MAG: Fic family protein [Proteobacteria bacterium]|nr:Fic family protein [Pseudomonadota bacterium]